MNYISKMIKKHKQRKKYKEYINIHKENILKAYFEMIRCKDLEWIIQDPAIMKALWYRALEHDDSKFDEEEFEPYRKYFYPIDEEEKENAKEDFQKAWEHHKQVNDHQWEHRIEFDDNKFSIDTELACLENIMDWLAMGYYFHNRPSDYYDAHKEEINLPKKQKDFIEKCIYQGIDKQYLINRKKVADNEISEEE